MPHVKDVIGYLETIGITTQWLGGSDSLSQEILRVNTDQDAKAGDLAWISQRQAELRLDAHYLFQGSLLIGPTGFEVHGLPYLACDSPKIAFIRAVNWSFPTAGAISWEERGALLPDGVEVHPSVKIAPGVRIGSGVRIHDGVEIGPNTVIANAEIHPNVKIGANCSIGLDGFGFEKDDDGRYWRFPHLGGVVIESNVEIGSNTCIDRGTIGNTLIRHGAKIDNLVHVAHNVIVGENSLVIAGSMIGGSAVIEESVWIAPSVSIMNQIHIGKYSVIGMGAVVLNHVEANSVMVGNPAKLLRKNAKET